MTSSVSDCCVSTVFQYRLDVSKLATACIESPIFRLSDVNWHIKFCRKQTSEYLAVHLVSSLDDQAEWSCEAKAMFKLLPNNDQEDKPIVKYLEKEKFSHNNLCHGFDEFIKWKEFLEKYVSTNETIFDIEVNTNPVNRIIPMDLDQRYNKLHLMVEKVSQFKEWFSSEVIVRSLKWKYLLQKKGDFLGIFLYVDGMEKNWSYKVESIFRLLSVGTNKIDRKLNLSFEFKNSATNRGFSEFLKWSDLIDEKNGYILNDTVHFEFELSVDEPTPLWEISEFHMKPGNSTPQCSICLELFSTGQICSTRCGHLFCALCFEESTILNEFCPMCKKPANSEELHPIYFT